MAKRVDLSTVTPERAAFLLRCREAKKREYQRRKEVLLERYRAWRGANLDRAKELEKACRDANPDRKAKNTRAYYERNREAVMARQRERDANLCDARVRVLYTRGTPLQCKDVPDELIPLIRTTILLKREIKEQKRELR